MADLAIHIIFVKMTTAVYKAQDKKLQNQRLGVFISTLIGTTADLIVIVVRMADDKTAVKTTETDFREFRSRQNKTKQTTLFPVTFQKPFSTIEEHFETIIMQIKEL